MRVRIVLLYKRSGSKFCFLYLKEALRLTILFLSGSPQQQSSKIAVRMKPNGLPTIIPLAIRKVLVLFKEQNLTGDLRNVVVATLSLLSIFRTFSVKVKPDFTTIVGEFTGKSGSFRTGLLALSLHRLRIDSLGLKKMKGLILETAGPNGYKSTFAATVDAAALALHPSSLVNLLYFNTFIKGGWKYSLWLLALIVLGAPLIALIWLFELLGFSRGLNLGKLSIVYDQAGKARVVAITNWWFQVALKPLHLAIFDILERIEEDGTFDQRAPLDKLISKVEPGQTFHSFDLSAATDRLPVDIQIDILNILIPNFGTAWGNLLRFPWAYPTKHRVKMYTYAVGQPMGAYSSWAMLALTHHVIVHLASLRAGLLSFNNYAILGDDIVIAHDGVAAAYLEIMSELGVAINLSKSLQSSHFAEFAKKLVGPGVDLSPIGPGLILRSVRSTFYLPSLFVEALNLSLITTLPELLSMIHSLTTGRLQTWNILWAVFGVNSPKSMSQIDANAITWCFSIPDENLPLFKYSMAEALKSVAAKEIRNTRALLQSNQAYFYTNVWSTLVSKEWSTRLLEALLMLASPGFWLYALSFIESLEKVALDPVNTGSNSITTLSDLAGKVNHYNVANIDWNRKQAVLDSVMRGKEVVKEFERTYTEITFETGFTILSKFHMPSDSFRPIAKRIR